VGHQSHSVCRLINGLPSHFSGRFLHWHKNHNNKRRRGAELKFPRPPWAINKDEIPTLEAIIPLLKTPSSWPPVRKFFTDMGFMKTSELLMFAGDVGTYFLKHMDIEHEHRQLFVRLMRVTQRSQHAPPHTLQCHHTPQSLRVFSIWHTVP
jgi:hypothetical protein